MTPEEVRALTNEELDKLVGVKVMGKSERAVRFEDWPDPYTTDGNDMLALIERMRAVGCDIEVGPVSFGPAGDPDVDHHSRLFDVTFERFDDDDDRQAFAMAATLPRAVAEASVLAVTQEERP